MRIPVSGQNNELIDVLGTDVRELISGLNPDGDGMIFYLTKLMLHNSHATQLGTFFVADSDESTTLTTGDAKMRLVLRVPPIDTLIVNFEDGEMPFVTNMVAGRVNGTFLVYEITASGYLA